MRGKDMAFWWVNQNQTWKHEIGGGYLWSPKRSQGNRRNQFYENMRIVETGDFIFSFYKQHIQHVGIAQRPALSGNKPADFGLTGEYWNNEGWFVPVEWHAVPVPLRPKDIIGSLRPHLPAKYSPLDQNGKGLQSVYLASVPDPMAAELIAQLGGVGNDLPRLSRSAGDGADAVRVLDDDVEKTIRNDTDIDKTERQAIINARRGQGRFRSNLDEVERCCRITRVSDPRLLRASHIKPWRSCANNHERLDGFNGLLLTAHIDHLFDRGYISFADDGELLVSSLIEPEQLARLGITAPPVINVGSFLANQKPYLAYHREVIFRG